MIAALWGRMTPLDRVLVSTLLAGVAASLVLVARLPAGARVVAERDGRVVFSAPLDQPRTVRLSGPLGDTLLEIAAGRACVRDSPCPHKVCMGMGEVSRRGELVACVPNRLVIRIEGGREEGIPPYDLLSR